MKTFALVAVLCLTLAAAYPYYDNYNNYMGMGQYYNSPYQYGGGMMGYNNYRSPYMGYNNYNSGYYPHYNNYNNYRRYGY